MALVANVGIAAIKFVAAGISGSAAMLAEGFHSVADSGNQLFLLRGTRASRFRPSVRYPFGRGKEIYFWSFLVAVVLFVGGGVVAFMEGLNRLRHPHPHEGGIAFNLVVLGVAAFFEIVVAFRVALKEFNRRRGTRGLVRTVREAKDPTLLVVLFEDSVAVLGLAVAAAGLLLAHWTGDVVLGCGGLDGHRRPAGGDRLDPGGGDQGPAGGGIGRPARCGRRSGRPPWRCRRWRRWTAC